MSVTTQHLQRSKTQTPAPRRDVNLADEAAVTVGIGDGGGVCTIDVGEDGTEPGHLCGSTVGAWDGEAGGGKVMEEWGEEARRAEGLEVVCDVVVDGVELVIGIVRRVAHTELVPRGEEFEAAGDGVPEEVTGHVEGDGVGIPIDGALAVSKGALLTTVIFSTENATEAVYLPLEACGVAGTGGEGTDLVVRAATGIGDSGEGEGEEESTEEPHGCGTVA